MSPGKRVKQESLHTAFEQSCVFSSPDFEKAHSELEMNEKSLLLKCNWFVFYYCYRLNLNFNIHAHVLGKQMQCRYM